MVAVKMESGASLAVASLVILISSDFVKSLPAASPFPVLRDFALPVACVFINVMYQQGPTIRAVCVPFLRTGVLVSLQHALTALSPRAESKREASSC